MMELIWLLLPIAAASGWWLARRSAKPPLSVPLNTEYFKGINYLLEDQQEQAIAVFTRMVEINRDAVDMQLTLANLFRRRGEVDRAIHIHHSLSNRSNLSEQQRNQARFELAEDYMRAGLFDRAETLYQALIEVTEHTATALHRLLEIYEQEKDWQQAIKHCDRLEKMTGQVRKMEAAHYCCELAEEALQRDQSGQRECAYQYLRQALQRDANCARASIQYGQMALADGNLELAIQHFQSVEQQGSGYFTEVIALLGQCYASLNQPQELIDYLHQIRSAKHSGHFTAAFVDLIAKYQGISEALEFLEQELQQHPTFMGLRRLVELKVRCTEQPVQPELQTIYTASRQMLNDTAYYRCDHCGFISKTLHWRCPSCKHWSSTKPLPDLIYNPGTQP